MKIIRFTVMILVFMSAAARAAMLSAAKAGYILIDAQGNIQQKWFGILYQTTVETYIRDYLATTTAEL